MAVVQFPSLPKGCNECARAPKCMGLSLDDLDGVRISSRAKILHKDEKLFSDGDPFTILYIVRSGCVKTYKITDSGEEQVIDFCLPGDMLGTNALVDDAYRCHAVALDTTSLCAFEYQDVISLCERSRPFRVALLKKFSSGIQAKEEFLLTLGTRDACERLASFVLMMSKYYGSRGFSDVEFVLPMSRADIAEYLMLAVETVSRLFSKLQSQRCIEVRRNSIKVIDMERLMKAAKVDPRSERPESGAH